MKGRSASKIKLTSYDELLGGGEETNDIQQVSLEHLHSFENHPFQVNDDEAMAELVESVKEEGILTALLVRPLGDGEYEIIAGHRRRHAAQLAGLKEVPVIIRNMDQDTAVRAMVDSNLQRPNILPSEKAFAYRMKMEAMNHQGTSGGTGVYKPHEYGDVILPLTVIRRFDCILSDTKDAVLQKYDEVKNLPMKDILLRKASKKDFYNTSKYTFERLMDDPDHIEENFREYLNKFSANVRDILEKFKFDGHITTMANKGILYIVLKEYTTDRGNLHPNEISNLEMGYIFEEIIRRFSESHNEDAGQHYTPREVIQLMVNILFYDDNDILSGNNVAKTIYDPACGTGGMLSVAEEYLHSLNASTELVSFGQEINDQTFAICKK